MIPWLVMGQLLSEAGQPLSALVDERIKRFPASGEINRRIADQAAAIDEVKRRFVPGAISVESIDGLSVAHERWRFNLRSSNTEPLVRLNVESRGDAVLMRERTAEILGILGRHA
jgi:phosphomannomutase